MVSADTVTERETSKADRMKRVSGGKEYAVDKELKVIIDEENGRIIINDGTDDRVVIGNLTF